MSGPDCVVVGFNEIEFDAFAASQRQFADQSGSYSEVRTNSVVVGGRRRTYMDLLNLALEEATGKPSSLNAFRMPNLGVAYLVSFMARRGIDVSFVNLFNTGCDELVAMLEAGARTVAITTTYYVDDEPIRQIVRLVREHSDEAVVIVGGPRVVNICAAHDPVRQDLLFRSIGADVYIHDSQGEKTLTDLVSAVAAGERDWTRIPNLVFPDETGRRFQRTLRVVENNDLDENAVDWSHFDPSFYTPTTYMRTARSCSFACAFCNYPAMAGPLTLSDVSTVEAELAYLYEHGTRNMIFVDDTFNVPLPRFKQILRVMIRNNWDFQWVSFFRCSNCDEEAFDLMAEAGCLGVFLGIESGDPTVLQNMNKFARVERYRWGISHLQSRGILTLASLVLGFPGETDETVRNTLEFVRETEPTFFNVQLYYHDVLAPIEQQRDQYGIRGSGYSWEHDTMDWREATGWKEYLIENIEESALLPLYGLSIWSLPYLLSQGFVFDEVVEFARGATDLLVRGLQTEDVDSSEDLKRLAAGLRR